MPFEISRTPTFLRDYRATNGEDHSLRTSAIDWFRQARFGLFMHYGLYSILAGTWQGREQPTKGSEWIQLIMEIPIKEYAKLRDQFTAEKFHADEICHLVKAAGMTYINITAQHHDGFCLWDTKTTDFSSMHAPARRDLIAELSEACDRHGLALFIYYSHGRDWWHPDSPLNNESSCRPRHVADRAHFHWDDDYDINRYLDFVNEQVTELCRYSAAGIWLDGIGTFVNMPDGVRISRCQELYDTIHAAAPHLLVAYKQGLTGTEDFFAPERSIQGMHREVDLTQANHPPYEICTTLQPRSWGYKTADDGHHRNADWVMDELARAASIPANLLLNSGPRGDGSIPEEDRNVLLAVGERLQAE
jgi:alpha-L-fucosidase